MLLSQRTSGCGAWCAALLRPTITTAVVLVAALTVRAGEEPVALPDSDLKVTVRTGSIPPAIHNSLPEDKESSYGLAGAHRVGLTQMILNLELKLDTNRVIMGTDDPDFWLSAVDITFGYRSIDIYIASKYPPGTCQYEAVLAHEREHVRADSEVVEAFAKKVKAIEFALHLPTPANPWQGKAARDGHKRAKAKVEELLVPLLAEMERKRRAASEALDPSDHRAFVQNACS